MRNQWPSVAINGIGCRTYGQAYRVGQQTFVMLRDFAKTTNRSKCSSESYTRSNPRSVPVPLPNFSASTPRRCSMVT